jgi:hypothetical protein
MPLRAQRTTSGMGVQGWNALQVYQRHNLQGVVQKNWREKIRVCKECEVFTSLDFDEEEE